MSTQNDPLKETFRRDADEALDAEVNAALSGVSLDALYAKSAPPPPPNPAQRAAQAAGPRGPRLGTLIRVDQRKDEVFVDFGGKTQGVISLSSFEEVPAVGQQMEFEVERFDTKEGLLLLRRKGQASQNVSWENLEAGQVVEGIVTGSNKGGLELQIKNMRAFMPSGQVALFFQPDIAEFVGQKMTVEVTQFDKAAKNLIVSRRNVLEREKESQKEKLLTEIAEGQTRRGTIRSIQEYGAFVDLGGLDGLLHVSEISHRRGTKVADVLKVGDVVEVKIIKFDPTTKKMSLSLRQNMADPWIGAADRYAVGTAVTGRVAKVESFGAFIEVEEGIEGLLPVSEMSWQRIGRPSDVVKEGDTLRLVVLSIDPTAKRMSFSLKQAGPDPWTGVTDRYAPGATVKGTVSRVVDFGAFIELESGLEGLVHISELSNQRVRAAGDIVKPGQVVDLRVLEVDSKARRISLSMKQAAQGVAEPAPGAAGAAGTAPAAKKSKHVRPLRGGLDF